MDNIKEIEAKLQETEQTIKTLNTQIKSLKEQLEKAEIENKRFKRVERNTEYYSVNSGGCGRFSTNCNTEDYTTGDGEYFNNNNYFLTKERAQEIADKMNFLLRLERLHDELCPDYTPDWTNENTEKYSIYYNNDTHNCDYNISKSWEPFGTVYFPTFNIVKKACEILDKELENNK